MRMKMIIDQDDEEDDQESGRKDIEDGQARELQ